MGFSEYSFDALSLWREPFGETSAVIHAASSTVKPASLTTTGRGVAVREEGPVLWAKEPAVLAAITLAVPKGRDAASARKCVKRLRVRVDRIPSAHPHAAEAAELIRSICHACGRCEGI